MTDYGLRALAQGCRLLHTLDVSSSLVSDEGIDAPVVKQRAALRPCCVVLVVLALMCFTTATTLAVHTGALSALSEHPPVAGAWRTWTITINPAAAKEAMQNLDAKNLKQDLTPLKQNDVGKSLVPVSKPLPDKAQRRRGARRNGGVSNWSVAAPITLATTLAAVYAVARHDAAATQRALAAVTGTLAELVRYAQGVAQNPNHGATHQEPPAADDWNLVGQDD